MVKLWEYPGMLDPEKGAAAYLFTIARNLVYNQIKRAGRESEILDEILWFAGASHDWVDLSLDIRQGKETLEAAIGSQPPQRQKIYRLCREQGLTYKQVAEQLHLSDATVDSQMVKTLKSIRHYLQANGMLSIVLALYTLKP